MVDLKLKKIFFVNLVYYLICVIVLMLSLRGIPGNPKDYDLNSLKWKEDGPLELSPDRGRFALIYSLVENKSLSFSLPLAKFATPDLGYANGKFVSLFDPGISFLVIPGYVLGRLVGVSQVGSFAIISIFAFLNLILIKKISLRLGANKLAASIAGLIFLFSTPAFTYSVTLYQHHVTTFIILFSIYLLTNYKNFWSLFLVWMLLAFSVTIDYPNFVIILPIIIFALSKIVSVNFNKTKINFKINFLYFFSIASALIPIAFLLWFNKYSYGNYFQLSSTVNQVTGFENDIPKNNISNFENVAGYVNPNSNNDRLVYFFNTRNMLNGLYILFISPDRGMIYYAPTVLLGIGGLISAYKSRLRILPVLVSILGFNILLYAMWGDPWGGWAFGSRYLIPSYAILSIFLAILLTKYEKKIILFPFLLIMLAYSVFINTAGAITTNSIPPQIEVLELEKISGEVQKYNYQKNLDLLNGNSSKSFIFETFGKRHINSWTYFWIIYILIMSLSVGFIISFYFDDLKKTWFRFYKLLIIKFQYE